MPRGQLDEKFVVVKLRPIARDGPVSRQSGVDKEGCARTLHRISACSNGPFIAVNCAAIPEALVESELFGIERGDFTSE
uniref:sigma 54-interacting transcriptional regulator n=1 Tax=Paraburkholderia TaxID=1822464 RepID=UPI0038BA4BD4